MKRSWRILLVLLVGAGLALTGFPMAYGQEGEEEDKGKEVYTLEEIVVTATKREEGILEVPLTMSAFDSRRLEALGMTSLSDLEQLTAGLQFGSSATQQRSDGDGIIIRGIGTQMSRELHTDLAVAVYVDGVYTVDSYGLAPNLFDVERVEVGRGPQGTLHGRNSIAGSISFVTRKPTDEWDAEVLTEFTDQFTQRYNLAFGGPIAELGSGGLSFRISGGYFDGDGAQENAGVGDDLDAPDQITFSPKLRFKTDRLDVNLSYKRVEDTGSPSQMVRLTEYSRDNPFNAQWFLYDAQMPAIEDCSPVTYEAWDQPWSPQYQQVICDDVENRVLSNRDGSQDSETDRYTANIDLDITDSLMLRYTYGSAETHTLSSQDSDYTDRQGTAADPSVPADLSPNTIVSCPNPITGVPEDMSEMACWAALAPLGVEFSDSENHHVFDNEESSHELQLITNFDGPLNLIAGVYMYSNEELWQHAGVNYASPWRFMDADAAAQAAGYASCEDMIATDLVGWPVGCPQGSDHTRQFSFFSAAETDTVAVFGSIDWRINDQWFVSAGLRWTEDEKTRAPKIPPAASYLFTDVEAGTVPNFYYIFDALGNGAPVTYFGSTDAAPTTTWDAVIGNISVEYLFGDTQLAYGRISTGYRAGGYNYDMVQTNPTFTEETVVNYEAGIKGLFLEDRLQLTSGIFYQDYQDYQIGASQRKPDHLIDPTDSSPLAWYTANVPDSWIAGFEVEATFFASERWFFSGYYTYLDSQIGPHSMVAYWDPDATWVPYPRVVTQIGPDVVCTAEWIEANPAVVAQIPGNCLIPESHDNTDNQLANQPHHKGSLTVAYTVPMPTFGLTSEPMGLLQLLTTYSYTGKRWASIVNIPRMEIPAYSRWDLRANWTSESGHWGAALYVQNVMDEIGITEFLAHDAIGSLSDPRQIGLQVRWKY